MLISATTGALTATCCAAVAFHIYDLNDSSVIEKDEVQRLLVALLQDNPAIDLTEDEIEQIVDQVCCLLWQ